MANMLIVTEGQRSAVSPSLAKGRIEGINQCPCWFGGTIEISPALEHAGTMTSAYHPAGFQLLSAERASCTSLALCWTNAVLSTLGDMPIVCCSAADWILAGWCFSLLQKLPTPSAWVYLFGAPTWGLVWKEWHNCSSYLLLAYSWIAARVHSCMLSKDVFLKIFVHRFLCSGLGSNTLLGAVSFAFDKNLMSTFPFPVFCCARLCSRAVPASAFLWLAQLHTLTSH